MEVGTDFETTQRKPKRRRKRTGIRSSKITEADAMCTDKRDYRPRIIMGGLLPWDFSGDNLDVKN